VISIQITTSGLKIESLQMRPVIKQFIRELTEYAYVIMRFEKAPKRTGRLRRSIKRRKHGYTGEVTVGVPYAAYVEFGTRPHVIRPVRARALRFKVGGDVVFAKLVHHPGTKPNPFMRRTAERTLKHAGSLFEKSFRRVTGYGLLH